MKHRAATFVLPLIGVLAIFALAAAVLFERELIRETPPDDAQALARWLARHPADWLAAARLTEMSLDSASPGRFGAWNDLFVHAKRLAPRRMNANAAFARAGLFHWYELSEADRSRVLTAVQPLLSDPAVYAELYQPLWQLTHDLKTLRRMSPPTWGARLMLKQTAVQNGLFDDYRALREEERAARLTEAKKAATAGRAAEVMSLLPNPLTTADHQLAELALSGFGRYGGPRDQLHVAPQLIDYALRHDLKSSGALRRILEDPDYPAAVRAKLALRLGEPEVAARIESSAADLHQRDWLDYYRALAVFEAGHGRAAEAKAALNQATADGLTPELLRAAAEVARLLQMPAEEARYVADLRALGARLEWNGTCGTSELCGAARATVRGGASMPITLDVVQTDQIAPYVEVYVDDRLVLESPVVGRVRLEVPLGDRSLHRIDLRVANPTITTGVQRRLRIS